MTTTKHSEAPWTAREVETIYTDGSKPHGAPGSTYVRVETICVTGQNGRRIASVGGGLPGAVDDEDRANSLLIENAPFLLEALELSPHRLADIAMGREWSCACPFCVAARAAVRAARGQS